MMDWRTPNAHYALRIIRPARGTHCLAQTHVEQFGSKRVPEAARLFAQNYDHLRCAVPAMPARYSDPSATTSLIEQMQHSYPMVAAISGTKLVGYLGGMLLPQLKGKDRGAFCPEWGHAVCADLPPLERRRIYRRLYEAIGEQWLREGRLNHAVSILAHDRDAVDAWFWSTFGLLVVDVVRDLSPVASAPGSAAGVAIRPATPDDAQRLLPVFAEHVAYYRRAPIWLPKPLVAGVREVVDELADPKSTVWLAEDIASGAVLGIMKHSVDSDDASTVVRDEATVACTGAYVLPASRGRGVGVALLNTILAWGRRNGYQRLSLDFEATNLFGAEFWLKHLTPVVYSVFRHVNDHMLMKEPPA